MKKHIVERAIVPHNPSASSIINKEKYNLYAPVARRNQPGIAEFNTEQFVLKDGVVSLNGNLIDMVNGEGEGAVQQIPNGVADGFAFGSNKNPSAVEFDPSLNGTIPYGATGDYAASFGGKSAAMGKRAFSEGTTTIAKGAYSHAEGNNSVALGDASHAEGSETTAKANYSHTEGGGTVGGGAYSHAEGLNTVAGDEAAHAEGENTKANARAAHAEGISNTVHAEGAHVEGKGNIIGEAGQPSDASNTGLYAHAEGSYNYVRGDHAHVEGQNNVIGPGANYAHVSGNDNVAKHAGAHLMGKGLVSGRQNQTVVGQYNEYDDDAMFIVAAGEKYEPRNLLVVRPDGSVEFNGAYYDHVITDRLELRNISSKKGRVLVKGVALTAEDSGSIYAVSSDVTLLEFSDCKMEDNYHTLRFNGHGNCTIKGLDLKTNTCDIRINGFGFVENCNISGDEHGSIENCRNVTGCSASHIRNCSYVSNCSMSSYYDSVISNCKYVCGISQHDNNANNTAKITCENCSFVSNVDADGLYVNCTYVDPDTCKGFVKDEDVGKVQVLTNDGTFRTAELGGGSSGGKLYEHYFEMKHTASWEHFTDKTVTLGFTFLSKSSVALDMETVLSKLVITDYGIICNLTVSRLYDSNDWLSYFPVAEVSVWNNEVTTTYVTYDSGFPSSQSLTTPLYDFVISNYIIKEIS